MAPKEEDGLGQDILSHSEDFRENWLEYHEDRLQELRDEFFRTSCHFCGKEFPTALKSFCHERFCKEGSKERFTCKVINNYYP
uniref:Uncharacterized protein n=1 Tax=Lutzomyia longipalpis TaxID=7200 RepID=A0A1B0CSI0_LUTLO